MKGFKFFFIALLLSVHCLNGCSQSDGADVTTDNHYEVVVVGGGIAGLTSAVFLADDGWDIMVLEKNAYPGGRAVSGEYQGLTYAKGTEYLGEPEWPLNKMINWLDLECVEIPSPLDAVYQDGEFYYGEEGIAKMYIEKEGLEDFNRFVGLVGGLENDFDAVYDFEVAHPIFELDNVTARQWLIENDLRGVYEDRFNVACRGLFGANIDELSILGVMPEIFFDFAEVDPLSNNDAQSLENNLQPKGNERTETYSFKKGIAEVPIAAAKFLGERIRYDSRVANINEEGGKYKIEYVDSDQQKHHVTADRIILATPAAVSASIAAKVLPDKTVELLKQVEYSKYLTIAMYSEEPIWESSFDLGVEEGWFFSDVYDATWIQKYFNNGLGEDVHVISLYVAPQNFRDHSLMETSDSEVLEKAYIDLEKLFPGVRSKITGTDIQRFNYAYPVFTPGYFGRAIQLNELNTGKVLLAGDYMLYPTFEEAAVSGANAAEKIMDE